MTKWFRQLLLIFSLLIPVSTFALGLGDINIHSFLHQNFDAEISLIEPGQTDLQNVQLGLGSEEQFKALALDRPSFLTDLQFALLKDSSGNPYIKITSTRAIDQSSLNFVVNMIWSNGSVSREYTVLLSPSAATSALKPAVTFSSSGSSNVVSAASLKDLATKNQELEEKIKNLIQELTALKNNKNTQAAPLASVSSVGSKAQENRVFEFLASYTKVIVGLLGVIALGLIFILFKDQRSTKKKHTQEKQVEPRKTKAFYQHNSHDQSSVIQEAKLYMNYSRYAQAENILLKSLQDNNKDQALWSLLLSVYAESYNREDFEACLKDIPSDLREDETFKQKIKKLRIETWGSKAEPVFNEQVKMPSQDFKTAVAQADPIKPADLNSDPDLSSSLRELDLEYLRSLDLSVSGETKAEALFVEQIEEDEQDSEFDFKNSANFSIEKTSGTKLSIADIDAEYSESTVENPSATKLDLIHAYIEMGDFEAAKILLQKVLQGNDPRQIAEAEFLLNKLSDQTSCVTP